MSGRCLIVALCVLGWSVEAGAQEPGNGRLRMAAGLFPVNLAAADVSAAPSPDSTAAGGVVSGNGAPATEDSSTPEASAAQGTAPPFIAERRACDGCPPRSV